MLRYKFYVDRYKPSGTRFPIGAKVSRCDGMFTVSGGAFGRAVAVTIARQR